MVGETASREAVIDALALEIVGSNALGRAVVAIDGIDGAGKTRFADDLGVAIKRHQRAVIRASVDGFHRPRVERYRMGKNSPEGYYADSFDYEAFIGRLVQPFRSGDPIVVAVFDVTTDTPVSSDPFDPPPASVLIVDGIFLNRPELRGLWNYSVWLEVSDEIADARLLNRDGPGSLGSRYTGGRALYRRQARPEEAATAVYDNSDFENPRRILNDSR